ncbi:MAG: hypothetical protein QM642_07015 [Edaphocola sp.]
MKFSRLCYVLACLLLLYSGSLFYPKWQQQTTEAQISWDAGGYYWYLPSAFTYRDMKKMGFKDTVVQKYSPTPPHDFQYAQKAPNGNYVMKYTMGTALLEMPTFLVAHAVAAKLGYPADGFSLPYQIAVYVGSILFSAIGLWFLCLVLRRYYSDMATGATLLLIVWGTNYLNYAGIDAGMSHCWLFGLHAMLLYVTDSYFKTFKRKYAVLIGLLLGLATLVRPPEIIMGVVPLLWGMDSMRKEAIGQRFLLWKKHFGDAVVALVAFAALASLQLIYWKWAGGSWFVYTYGDQRFVWLQPHLWRYAFNYDCGWLVYTPLMFFALAGMVPFFKNGQNKVAVLLFLLLNYYVVASWDLWQYGGRAMVQSYAVFSFPLASLIGLLLQKRRWLVVVSPFILVTVYFNLWWTYQAHKGGLTGSAPTTSKYYWHTIFRYDVPVEMQMLRDNKDFYNQPVVKADTLLAMDFTNKPIVVSGHDSLLVNVPAEKLGKYKWLRATALVHIGQKEWGVWDMTMLQLRQYAEGALKQENTIRIQRLLQDGQTRNVWLDVRNCQSNVDNAQVLAKNGNYSGLPLAIYAMWVIGITE